MRSILVILLLGLSYVVSAQQSTTYTLYFDFNKHQLSKQASQELDLLLLKIEDLDNFNIKIEAHTDDKGTHAYNKRLAHNRAKTVQKFLEEKGLSITSSNVINFGEDRPSYDNEEEEGRKLNRRVDVILTTVPFESLDDLMAKLRENKQQKFTINPHESQQIKAEEGTSFWIPASSFQFKDGSSPEGPIEIIIEEHYNKSDMVTSELSTHSNGRMLETGGMIYLAAQSNGKELDIKEGSAITIGMPTDNQQEGMQLFNAQTDGNGRPVDWVPSGQDFAKNQQEALLLPPAPQYPLYIRWNVIYSRNWKKGPTPPAPISVYKYREPQKPTLERVQYDPPFLKKLFMGKDKIQAKKQEIYEAQLVKYHKNMVNYEKRLVRYEKAREDYEKDMEKYLWNYETWDGIHVEDSLEFAGMHSKLENEYRALVLKNYEAKRAVWNEQKDSIMTAYYETQRKNGTLNMDGLKNYFYKLENPGWINCDRFYNVPANEKMALAVNDTDTEEEKIFLVFKEINSMMRLAYKQGTNYIQNDLPKNAEVKIIALKINKGQPSMAVLDTRVGAEPVIDLNYKNCKIRDIKKVMESI